MTENGGTLNNIWFLRAKWPLTANSEITTEHFEDLRKMSFGVAYPECGRVPYDYVLHHGEDLTQETTILGEAGVTSDITTEPCVVGEMFIRTSKTKVWTSGEEVSKGCWRTYPHIDGDVYEALDDLGGEDETANTTAPSSSENWHVVITPALVFVNCAAKDYSGITEFTDANFPMPDVHPAHGVWMGGNAAFESEGWALAADRNKYHTWDWNSPYKRCETLNYDNETYVYKIMAHKFLPMQLDARERGVPWVYQGSYGTWLDRAYRFKKTDKKSWAKDAVTIPDRLGPYFTTTKDREETAFANNQYWSDEVWPDPTGTPYYNDKVCDSLQAMTEFLMSNKKYCWPVNQTYIDNWEAAHPGSTWQIGVTGCDEYPSLSDEYWGCNGSPFEFFLSVLGRYDWYFDTNLKYIPDSILQYQDDANLSDFQMGFTDLKGTWRRTWSYSMNRVSKKYMRSGVMGVPTGDTYSITHWSGLYVSTMPGRDQFDTTTGVTVSAKTDYSVTIASSYSTSLKVGDMIRIYHTADSIDDDVMAWIISKEIVNSALVLKLSDSISALSATNLLIGFNAAICDRHDAVTVDFEVGSTTPYPKFNLQWQMLQDVYDILMQPIYIKAKVGLTVKNKSYIAGWDNTWSYLTIGTSAVYLAQKRKEIIAYFDSISVEDNANPSDNWASGGSSVGGGWSGSDIHAFGWDGVSEEAGWHVYWQSNDVSETRLAVKVTASTGYEDDFLNYSNVKGNGSITIPVRFGDCVATQDLTPDYYTPLFGGCDENGYYLPFVEQKKPTSVGGLSQELIPYEPAPDSRYGTITLSDSDDADWYILKCSFPSIVKSAPYRMMGGFYLNPTSLSNSEYYWEYGGGCSMGLHFYSPYIYFKLDFNKIPQSVFIDADGRDRIGAGEPIGTPEGDTTPPSPDPAKINLNPKLIFTRVEIAAGNEDMEHPVAGWYSRMSIICRASDAEDLESNVVWYKPIIATSGEDTPPAQNYGTSPICTIKVRDDVLESSVISSHYTYSGTPTQSDGIWTLNIGHDSKIHVGDEIYIPAWNKTFTVTARTSFTISFEKSEAPSLQTNLSIWDVSGYNQADWAVDVAHNWSVAVITKDGSNNETAESDYELVEVATDWPLDVFLEAESLSLDVYKTGLE